MIINRVMDIIKRGEEDDFLKAQKKLRLYESNKINKKDIFNFNFCKHKSIREGIAVLHFRQYNLNK